MSPFGKLSERKPWQIDVGAVALLALLAAAVYWIEVSASLGRHNVVLAKTRELESRQAKQRDVERALVAVRQRTDAATKLMVEAGFTLDSASRVNARLAQLTSLAASTGVQMEGIEPSKAVASGRLASVSIRLAARGNYAAVSKFIHVVREGLPDCAITSLELTATPAVHEPVANVIIQIQWHATPDNRVAAN